jgi:hypothetical protein
MNHKLILEITELVGSFPALYVEYYSHTKADMWKWNYPLTQYRDEKWPLCKVGEDSEESYTLALKKIIDLLETKKSDGKLSLDKVKDIRDVMSPTVQMFFDNLYVIDKSIALWSYDHLSSGKYTVDKVLNMTCSKLIKENITVSMSKQNMFALPF